MTIDDRAKRIKLLLFDVDGVLTDGTVQVHADGTESKVFGIRDGIAVVWAQRMGLRVGLLSARASGSTPHRAAQLGIRLIHQGVASKALAFERILEDEGLDASQVAYMGDDIVDLAVLARAGLAAAPGDAVAEVRERVHWVSKGPGGNGAVRELVELVLRAQGHWDTIISSYLNEGAAETSPRVASAPPARS